MKLDGILKIAASDFAFDPSTLAFISDSTNVVYQFYRDGKRHILRLSQRPASKLVQIQAEMDWLAYLYDQGICVSMPVKSVSGELAVGREWEGRHYILCAFPAASGMPWDRNDPKRWGAKVFLNWGKAMGSLHRVTQKYEPVPGRKRPDFTGREAVSDSIDACAAVVKVCDGLIPQLLELPKAPDGYGLIHADLHPWNFFIDGDRIRIFDFDDSLYSYFVMDIAIALYHGLWWGRANDAGEDFTEPLISEFLRGYFSENRLGSFWIPQIVPFMRYRQICRLSWFYDPQKDAQFKEEIEDIVSQNLFPGCSAAYVDSQIRRAGALTL